MADDRRNGPGTPGGRFGQVVPRPEVLGAPLAPARVLCFAPHPDDEVLGAGGTLRLHVLSGSPVQVVLATDGASGDPDGRFAGESLAARRRDESRRGTGRLGLPEPEFWGYPDGHVVVEADKLGLIDRVTQTLQALEPTVVYLPWSGDNHSDHLVLHEVVVRGMAAVGFQGEARGYEVWAPIERPDLVIDITAVKDEKDAALACYESQFAYGDLAHQVFGINAYRSLLLERSGGFGEAFERVQW